MNVVDSMNTQDLRATYDAASSSDGVSAAGSAEGSKLRRAASKDKQGGGFMGKFLPLFLIFCERGRAHLIPCEWRKVCAAAAGACQVDEPFQGAAAEEEHPGAGKEDDQRALGCEP